MSENVFDRARGPVLLTYIGKTDIIESMDILAAMRIFVRVVERGNMSAAARDLNLGQPAVSERIERLEAHLGTRLLRRNTRHMSVTESGARFYERSKSALFAADYALAAVANSDELRGSIRIAAPYSLGESVLIPALIQLRRQHPKLNIDVVLNDRVIDPVTEGVDISLRLGEAGEGYFVARALGTVTRYLVAAPSYIARYGAPSSPGELIHHAFGRVSGLFTDNRLPLLTEADALVGAAINVAFSVNHWRPLYDVILAGDAIGVLQAPVCQTALAQEALVPLLTDYVVPPFPAFLLYPPAAIISPETRKCVDFLAVELGNAIGDPRRHDDCA